MKFLKFKTVDVKSIIIGALSATLIFVIMGNTNSYDDITCKSLTVVNSDGEGIIYLQKGDKGGYVVTYNNSGKLTTYIGTNTEAAGHMKTFNAYGDESCFIGTNTSDAGQMQAFNAGGTNTVYCGTASDGGGMLRLKDKGGETLFEK